MTKITEHLYTCMKFSLLIDMWYIVWSCFISLPFGTDTLHILYTLYMLDTYLATCKWASPAQKAVFIMLLYMYV